MTLPKVLILSFFMALLTSCSSSSPTVYKEADLPTAVPPQFQGWWKGKSEWDYLSIAPDGLMRTVMPVDLQNPFDPALSKPNVNSYMKVFRNQGDTLYGISKEQRFDRASSTWKAPVYYYVTLYYEFKDHILTYRQEPCMLGEEDMQKSPEEHLARLARHACTTIEEGGNQNIWKRTTTYYRYAPL